MIRRQIWGYLSIPISASPSHFQMRIHSLTKWDLGSITLNISSGGDGIPAELFQILKDDAALI